MDREQHYFLWGGPFDGYVVRGDLAGMAVGETGVELEVRVYWHEWEYEGMRRSSIHFDKPHPNDQLTPAFVTIAVPSQRLMVSSRDGRHRCSYAPNATTEMTRTWLFEGETLSEVE